jgi:hypothetical protein
MKIKNHFTKIVLFLLFFYIGELFGNDLRKQFFFIFTKTIILAPIIFNGMHRLVKNQILQKTFIPFKTLFNICKKFRKTSTSIITIPTLTYFAITRKKKIENGLDAIKKALCKERDDFYLKAGSLFSQKGRSEAFLTLLKYAMFIFPFAYLIRKKPINKIIPLKNINAKLYYKSTFFIWLITSYYENRFATSIKKTEQLLSGKIFGPFKRANERFSVKYNAKYMLCLQSPNISDVKLWKWIVFSKNSVAATKAFFTGIRSFFSDNMYDEDGFSIDYLESKIDVFKEDIVTQQKHLSLMFKSLILLYKSIEEANEFIEKIKNNEQNAISNAIKVIFTSPKNNLSPENFEVLIKNKNSILETKQLPEIVESEDLIGLLKTKIDIINSLAKQDSFNIKRLWIKILTRKYIIEKNSSIRSEVRKFRNKMLSEKVIEYKLYELENIIEAFKDIKMYKIESIANLNNSFDKFEENLIISHYEKITPETYAKINKKLQTLIILKKYMLENKEEKLNYIANDIVEFLGLNKDYNYQLGLDRKRIFINKNTDGKNIIAIDTKTLDINVKFENKKINFFNFKKRIKNFFEKKIYLAKLADEIKEAKLRSEYLDLKNLSWSNQKLIKEHFEKENIESCGKINNKIKKMQKEASATIKDNHINKLRLLYEATNKTLLENIENIQFYWRTKTDNSLVKLKYIPEKLHKVYLDNNEQSFQYFINDRNKIENNNYNIDLFINEASSAFVEVDKAEKILENKYVKSQIYNFNPDQRNFCQQLFNLFTRNNNAPDPDYMQINIINNIDIQQINNLSNFSKNILEDIQFKNFFMNVFRVPSEIE